MKTVAAQEVGSRVAEILSAVEHGEDCIITRGGQPIARIVAARSTAEQQAGTDVSALIDRINALCDSGKPAVFDVREAIEDGRD